MSMQETLRWDVRDIRTYDCLKFFSCLNRPLAYAQFFLRANKFSER
jgi:hypothetical protein